MGQLSVLSYQFYVKRVESSELKVERKEKQIPRCARDENWTRDCWLRLNVSLNTPASEGGRYKCKDQPKRKECRAFDRRSPPFAKSAKDGAPSSSCGKWCRKANPGTDPKVGHYKGKHSPKRRECVALDRRSPPFAKSAKDGVPSSSYVRRNSVGEAR
jgi:hypothetical protein